MGWMQDHFTPADLLTGLRRPTPTIFTPIPDELGCGAAGAAPAAGPADSASRIGDAAYTLLELLTVIAVIGILAAILFPGLTAARVSANKARTRVQFSQWAAAIEAFRSEYGYYPALHSSALVNPPGQATDPGLPHLFHDLLAARRRDGSALPLYTIGTDSLSAEAQNRKLVSFHTFGLAEFTAETAAAPNLLHDAFDQTEIAVLVDRNLDGIIMAGSDFTTLPAVGGIRPGLADFPAAGIRAGVIFYSCAPGATVRNPGFIFSWK